MGGSDTLDGGAGYDVLTGGEGDDMLVGGDSEDGDYLRGGLGSDTYIVGPGWCFVEERDGEGTTDRVRASADFRLNEGAAVEIVTTADARGLDAIDLYGNEFANVLIGNAGSNILAGGLGADRLVGGAGQDVFHFDAALGAGNVDRIADFDPVYEGISLDDAVFGRLGPRGTLSADAFVIGPRAQGAEDRIIYNATTGALFHDADGSGAGAAVRYATLSTGLELSHFNFGVV